MSSTTSTNSSYNCYFVLFLVIYFCSCALQSSGFAPTQASAMTHPTDFVSTTATTVWFQNNLEHPKPIEDTPVTASKTQATTTKIRKEPVVISDLVSSEELLAFLGKDEKNVDHPKKKPAVVFYYASWCRRCQRVGMQLNRVARQLGGRGGPFRFAMVECKPSTQDFILNTMGVDKIPNLRVYQGGSLDYEPLVDAGSSVRDLADELAAILEGQAETPVTSATAVHEQLQLSLGVASL